MEIDLVKTMEVMRGYNAAIAGMPLDKEESDDWQEGWHIGQQHSMMGDEA